MPGALPPPASAAPPKLQELVKGAAPAGPAPAGLPPGLLQRAREGVTRISREEVAGNDESFANDKDDSYAQDRDDSYLKVELGDSDEERAEYERAPDDANERRYAEEDSYDDRYRSRDDEDDEAQYRDRDDEDDYNRGYDRYRDDDRDQDDSYVAYDRREENRGGRGKRYESDEDYMYSEDDETRAGAKEEAEPRAGVDDIRGGNVIDLERRPAYPYSSTSRIPVVTADTIFNFQSILKATYRELRNFVLSPVEPGTLVRCYIERSRNGGDAFAPAYSLCADLEDGTGRELMVCKKVFYSTTSHYVFSLKAEDLYRRREQRSRLYLGKLRQAAKDTYVLFDNGNISPPENKDGGAKDDSDDEKADEKPDVNMKADGKKNSAEVSLYRKEMAIIYNNTKKRPAEAGVRGTEVCIPASYLNADEQLMRRNNTVGAVLPDSAAQGKKGAAYHVSTVPICATKSMHDPFQRVRAAGKQNSKQTKRVFVLHERTSKYDPLSSCLVDFKSRATIPSVKNCQFVESSPQDGAKTEQVDDHAKGFLMQMGKTTEDCFNMDTTYPLCLLQAFAICIARFDSGFKW